jgi:hypothetical protein
MTYICTKYVGLILAGAMDHSKPLVMTKAVQEYSNFLFHRGVDVVHQQSTLHKNFDKLKKLSCLHPEDLDNLYIIIHMG